jgi:SNF family Na+-dependent transporter
MGGLPGVGSAFAILSFYGVVGGWIMKYIIISVTDGFKELAGDTAAAESVLIIL